MPKVDLQKNKVALGRGVKCPRPSRLFKQKYFIFAFFSKFNQSKFISRFDLILFLLFLRSSPPTALNFKEIRKLNQS